MYTVGIVYHKKPECYKEAEPENIRASSHPRGLDAFLILATGAARHRLFRRLADRFYTAIRYTKALVEQSRYCRVAARPF